MTPKPSVGSMAPDFTLRTDEGRELTLSSLRGRPVVLFFYPKDNTPGCTIEACAMRDAHPRFGKMRAVVLGISPDSVASHAKFRARFSLPYHLLADTEKTVVNEYGVWALKSMFGLKFMGVERTTFVIDAAGNVTHVFEKVKPLGHAAAVMQAVAALG